MQGNRNARRDSCLIWEHNRARGRCECDSECGSL